MRTLIYSILLAFSISIIVYGCKSNIENNNQTILTGKLESYTFCKSGIESVNGYTFTSDTLSCINFSFDGLNKKLTIKHLNAGFNCCPDSLFCNFRFSNDTIIVQEFEKSNNCKCSCLYDLDIEIYGVIAKKYQIRIIEPYSGEWEKINIGIDLAQDKNGSFCVSRRHYPWGI